MTDYPIFDGNLEIRQSGRGRVLGGRFNYRSMATIRDRGRVRKERFESRAFRFAIEQEPERRIDILVGHDYGKPIASRQAGTLTIEDSADAVTFEAVLPDDPAVLGNRRGAGHCGGTDDGALSRLYCSAVFRRSRRGETRRRAGQSGRPGAGDPRGRVAGVFRCDFAGLYGRGG